MGIAIVLFNFFFSVIYVILDLGIAREWIKSKPGYSANAPTEFETYEQIEADSVSSMFSTIITIFHKHY